MTSTGNSIVPSSALDKEYFALSRHLKKVSISLVVIGLALSALGAIALLSVQGKFSFTLHVFSILKKEGSIAFLVMGSSSLIGGVLIYAKTTKSKKLNEPIFIEMQEGKPLSQSNEADSLSENEEQAAYNLKISKIYTNFCNIKLKDFLSDHESYHKSYNGYYFTYSKENKTTLFTCTTNMHIPQMHTYSEENLLKQKIEELRKYINITDRITILEDLTLVRKSNGPQSTQLSMHSGN